MKALEQPTDPLLTQSVTAHKQKKTKGQVQKTNTPANTLPQEQMLRKEGGGGGGGKINPPGSFEKKGWGGDAAKKSKY